MHCEIDFISDRAEAMAFSLNLRPIIETLSKEVNENVKSWSFASGKCKATGSKDDLAITDAFRKGELDTLECLFGLSESDKGHFGLLNFDVKSEAMMGSFKYRTIVKANESLIRKPSARKLSNEITNLSNKIPLGAIGIYSCGETPKVFVRGKILTTNDLYNMWEKIL